MLPAMSMRSTVSLTDLSFSLVDQPYMPDALHVLGRFPPPFDGQSLATERLATLLEPLGKIRHFNLNPGGAAFAQSRARFRPNAAWYFLRVRRTLQKQLSALPNAPVLWTTISPAPLGHVRDVLTVAPALQPGQRVYAAVHHGDFDRVFRSALTAPTARRLLRRITRIVFLSEHLAQQCAAWVPPAQRAVIPNTIDAALICSADDLAAKRSRRRAGGPLRLLFLSHMIPSKGYLDVVHAVGVLYRRGVSIRADFVGRWDSESGEKVFNDAVRDLGVGDIVAYHGGIEDRATAKQFYLNADVFLLPTYYPTEAQPLTVIEALNAGTPVVVTAHAGLPEMVRDGVEGHLVPKRDPAAIAAAIERLCDLSHWNALSAGARTRFDTLFSPDAVRLQWTTLLTT